MLAWIDRFLDKITMYRLVLYYCAALLAAAVIFGMAGILPYHPSAIVFSAVILVAVSWAANRIFARLFGATENVESVYITALILALIINPAAADSAAGIGFLVFAAAWAMASKYFFAVGKKHIFNPAAFAVALAAIAINQSATWWVGGNLPLLPLVFIGGILIVRKVRRTDLVLSFAAVALGVTIATAASGDFITPVAQTFLHSSFFFFAFVMLTEPMTAPPRRTTSIIYGAIVGFLFVPSVHLGALYFTPELALVIGNVFSYLASPKERLMLTLKSVSKIGTNAYEYVFTPDKKFPFVPGQYLEWTLGHRSPDNRGNRRYFTIASSPTENDIRLGVKFSIPASSFKRALGAMRPGDAIFAAQRAGNFTLPENKKQKLAFIAGGIGITPFRSMIKYMIDTKDVRDATLIYSNKTANEIAYKDIFDRAESERGIKTVYCVTQGAAPESGAAAGHLDAAFIAREIPDYRERLFFISGPPGMVAAYRTILRGMDIPRRKIKTDFFPGFA